KFSVRKIEEVPAAAGGIENFEAHQFGSKGQEILHRSGLGNSFAPWLRDCRRDDACDIGFGCEVSAVSVAVLGVHALLEDRAEDCRIHLRPVASRRAFLPSDQRELVLREIDRSNDLEEPAIEIRNALEAP